MEIKRKLKDIFKGYEIVILGFGEEGKSSYNLIRKYFPERKLIIADKNPEVKNQKEIISDRRIQFYLGENYLEVLDKYDFILKTPGISLKDYSLREGQIMSSQTDIFIQLFKDQIIGVTGTKGKSTTSSLIAFILEQFGRDVHLLGNIGKPAFSSLDKISEYSIIIYELSSHQLEFVNNSPHIAVLLNLYQEHLDHYKSYFDYQKSKLNIALFQDEDDFFITNKDNSEIVKLLSNFDLKPDYFSSNQINKEDEIVILKVDNKSYEFKRENFKLVGDHNLQNLLAALISINKFGFDIEKALQLSFDFKALEHRMEFVGEYKGVKFYNDSIATIPEACINALESLDNVNHLIIGGYNRGIDYDSFVDYLISKNIKNIYLIDEVGELMYEKMKVKSYSGKFSVSDITNAVEWVFNSDDKGVCLLSPAARTALPLKNYKERGKLFKDTIKNYA